MVWKTPKLDWKVGDTPNSDDLKRWDGNPNYLKDEVDILKVKKATKTTLGQVIIGDGINVDATGKISTQEIEMLESIKLYCNSVTGNDANDGKSSTRAFKTFGKAVEVSKRIITNRLEIVLANGTYTSVPLAGIQSGFITISGNYSTIDSIVMNGDINLDDMVGKFVRLLYFKLNGIISGVNNPCSLRMYMMKVTGSINLEITPIVEISGGSITNPSMVAIGIKNCGVVKIDNCITTGAYGCINIENVGSAYLYNVTLNTTTKLATIPAIDISSGSTVYVSGLKGTLGTTPVLRTVASIIFKDIGMTVTGATDIKERGGQIFS